MSYNIRKFNPFLIAIPDIGIGMFWSLTGTIGSWIAYQHTDSAFLVGLLTSMAAFTGIFIQIISGILSDKTNSKWGKRTPWILFGLVMACVFQMLWPFAIGYISLFIIAFFTYLFINFYQGPYYTMVVEVVDKDQIQLSTMLARTTAQVGTMIIGGIAAWMWATGGAFLSCMIISIILFVPTILIIPFTVKERPENYTSSAYKIRFDVFKDRNINLLFISTFCFLFGFGAYMPLMGSYMNHFLGFSKDFTSELVFIFGLTCMIVGIFATIFLNKFSAKKLYIIGMLLFAVGIGVGSLFRIQNDIFYIITVMVAFGFIFCQFASYTLVAKFAPANRLGEYMGWINLFFSLPQFIIMIGGGIVMDIGIGNILYPVAALILLFGAYQISKIKY